MPKQNILLIVNPISGRKRAKTIIYCIIDALCRNDYKTTIFTTTKKGEAIQIIQKHAYESQKIICCGGDGTLNEVLTGLAKTGLQIPVGYIPAGTTNDLAHALCLPNNSRKATDIVINGVVKKHDIGVFNDQQFFSYVASFGAFAKVSYATPQWLKNILGRFAYIFSGILSLGDIHPHTVKIIADGKEISGDFVYGSVSNSTVIGGILKFPKSEVKFNDGKFEVMLIKNPTNPKQLRSILRSIFNHQYDDCSVLFFRASSLSFCFNEKTEWTIDGEFAGITDTIIINNFRSPALIISPEETSLSTHRSCLLSGILLQNK